MKKKTKFVALRATVIALFVILAGRLWYVQVVMGSYYKSQADTSKIRLEPVQALRGIIYDNTCRQQLVRNAPSWNVGIVPHGIPANRANAIYAMLARLLHDHPNAASIGATVRAYSWRPYVPAPIKSNVDNNTAMIIKQLHAELPGVTADPSSVRQYIQDSGSAVAHLLGYTNQIGPDTLKQERRTYPALHIDLGDQTGGDGIEMALDPYLHGVNGREQVEVDAGERPVRVLQRARTVPGDAVCLTINWKLQQQVSADLSAALRHLRLRQGVAILEDVHSGQILAMSSLPSFNNNQFAGGIPTKLFARLNNDPGTPLLDLATQGVFAPGSTYKLITATAALQTGVANASRTIDDTGQIQPCPSCPVFHGWKPGGLGQMNIISALSLSSDIYFYTVAGGNPAIGPMPYIGGTRLAYWARQYGLGSPTGIELPGEASGFVPTPFWFNHHPADGVIKNPGDTWTIGYNYNSAIGQGFDLTTPLQMVNVAATIANGGTLYRPRIVKEIVGRVVPRRGILARAQVVQPFVPHPVRSNFIDPGNLSLIQQGMHGSVTNDWNTGTGYFVYDPRIDAAGKTGTAEDNPRPPHAWWVGYAPYTNPKVAVVVMIPNANGEGAYVAAPIAHKLLEDYFHLKPSKPKTPGPCGCWLDDVSQTLVGSGGGGQ